MYGSHDSRIDAADIGRQFEALIRLECELRLNKYEKEAEALGLAVRTLDKVEVALSGVGRSLGLLPAEYRRDQAQPLSRTAHS